MRLLDDTTLALSPSDLSNHLACPHLTTLTLAVVREELAQPHADDTHVDLIRRKGDEHEAAYLARLANGAGANRRARRAARSLRERVDAVATELVAGPVERELDAHERLCAAVETARNR